MKLNLANFGAFETKKLKCYTKKKGFFMDATTKGIEALRNEIKLEIRAIFELNMKLEGWSVPELDDKKAANQILYIMQDTVDELKKEVKTGRYDTDE